MGERVAPNEPNSDRGQVSGVGVQQPGPHRERLAASLEPPFCAKRTQFDPMQMCAKCFMTKGLGMVQRRAGLEKQSQNAVVGSLYLVVGWRANHAKRSQFRVTGARARATKRLAASLRTALPRQTKPICFQRAREAILKATGSEDGIQSTGVRAIPTFSVRPCGGTYVCDFSAAAGGRAGGHG